MNADQTSFFQLRTLDDSDGISNIFFESAITNKIHDASFNERLPNVTSEMRDKEADTSTL